MKILFVQITDIHLEAETPIEPARAELIGSTIANSHTSCPDSIVMIYSGDFVWSGKPSDFAQCAIFLNQIENSILSSFPRTPLSRIICPGNHDCELPKREQVRQIIVDSAIKTGIFHGEFFDEALAVHQNFFVFGEQFEPSFKGRKPLWSTVSNSLGWQISIDAATRTLNFICLNSAWLSLKHEDPGTIHFPADDFLSGEENVDLTIGVIHHPLSWMNPETAHRLRQGLLHRVDFLFTGHEHTAVSLTLKDEITNCEVKLIEGASFFDKNTANNDGFVTVMADLDASSYSPRLHKWNIGGYSSFVGAMPYDPQNDASYNYALARKAANGTFPRFSLEFDRWLDDAGLPLFNGENENIGLGDVYTVPELRTLRIHGAPTLVRPIDELTKLLDYSFAVVLGSSNSGKTSLAFAST